MPSALVTGGAGFIGSELSHSLVGAGYDVTAVDCLHPQVHAEQARPLRLNPVVDLVVADVTDAGTWDALLPDRSFDIVVHLAAETGTGQSLTEATRHGLVNVVGTTQMFDALLRHDRIPAHVVLASSRAVYGEGDWVDAAGVPHHPDVRRHDDLAAGIWDPLDSSGVPLSPVPASAGRTNPRPTNVYAATKLAQEHICTAWTAATGSALSVLRLQNVYGPGQSLTNSYTGVVALFARLTLEQAAIDVYEDGLMVRDFVFVDDVVAALAAAVAEPPAVRRIVDVGSGEPTTVLETAQLLAEIGGAPAPTISGRFRDGDVRAASCDVTPTMAELDWAPTWDLRRGLDALLKWVAEQRDEVRP